MAKRVIKKGFEFVNTSEKKQIKCICGLDKLIKLRSDKNETLLQCVECLEITFHKETEIETLQNEVKKIVKNIDFLT